jgi:hypothetical protein
LIAQGVAPFSPEAVAFRAGWLILKEINLYVKRGEDFGFETTLSARSYLGLIRRLKKRGYKVHFFFLMMPKPLLSRSQESEGESWRVVTTFPSLSSVAGLIAQSKTSLPIIAS